MKKPSWLDDFRAFIARGNVLDMAVGVVIGTAFTAVITAVVESIINPIIGVCTGGVDASSWTIGIFPIGTLIMAIINFLVIAFVVFWMVRIITRGMEKIKSLRKEEETAPEAPPEPSNEEKLLMEIRDLLKEQKGQE